MERIEPAVWTDRDRALWARIAGHDFEPGAAALAGTAFESYGRLLKSDGGGGCGGGGCGGCGGS